MNEKVNNVLADTRRILIQHIEEIDTSAPLSTIECRVADAVNWFYTYLHYIACFHETGDISDEEEEYLTKSAYYEFYK